MKFKVKSKMSINDHLELGQAIKDAIVAMRHVLNLVQKFDLCLACDVYKMEEKACYLFEDLRSSAEDKMFREHGELDNRAFSVYYHDDEKISLEDIR